MRFYFSIVAYMLCLLLLVGCASESSPATPDIWSSPDQPHMPQVSSGDIADEPIASTSPDEIPVTPDDIPRKFPYKEMLDASFSLFSEPKYDSTPMGVVGKSDEYYIREEATDDESNLWGKVEEKCWVNLTYAREFAKNPPPITANHADRSVIQDDHYEYAQTNEINGVAIIAFRAKENLKNVKFTSITWNNGGFETVDILYTLDALTPEKPLIAKVMFLGSGTVYGISFEDASGVGRYYSVTESGRNGEIGINEYTAK